MTEILRNVGTIARALDSISNIEFQEIHLTRGQYLYLVRIVENPGIIQEKLAELLKVDRTTTARAVKKLVAIGLVEKKADRENKKIKRLQATKQGQAVYPFVMREHVYSEMVALRGLSVEEQHQLETLLTRVSQNIEGDWQLVKKGQQRKY
jgi:DNA-binding MarR family transcriptional regulator